MSPAQPWPVPGRCRRPLGSAREGLRRLLRVQGTDTPNAKSAPLRLARSRSGHPAALTGRRGQASEVLNPGPGSIFNTQYKGRLRTDNPRDLPSRRSGAYSPQQCHGKFRPVRAIAGHGAGPGRRTIGGWHWRGRTALAADWRILPPSPGREPLKERRAHCDDVGCGKTVGLISPTARALSSACNAPCALAQTCSSYAPRSWPPPSQISDLPAAIHSR
jgi:hypothetical protein